MGDQILRLMVFFCSRPISETDSKNLNNATASIYSIANSFMRLDKTINKWEKKQKMFV